MPRLQLSRVADSRSRGEVARSTTSATLAEVMRGRFEDEEDRRDTMYRLGVSMADMLGRFVHAHRLLGAAGRGSEAAIRKMETALRRLEPRLREAEFTVEVARLEGRARYLRRYRVRGQRRTSRAERT